MDKDGLVFSYITEYMRAVRRERGGKLGDLERYARQEKFPIAEPETADLLQILCGLMQPDRIIEIGTCIGFSALLMHEACPGAEILTMERNPVMIRQAMQNFAAFDAQRDITLLEGDACEILPTIPGTAGLIFMDAAKGQYPVFLKECLRLLRPGGILVADNVLFNGMVASGKPDIRRNKTILTRLDMFVRQLESEESLTTVILPISDGVTVSFRRKYEKDMPTV